MKYLINASITLLSILSLNGCSEKTLSTTPAYPPETTFFSVSQQKADILATKKLTIFKLDASGKKINSKLITNPILTQKFGTVFRLFDSWYETKSFFNEGINTLIFSYDNQLLDNVTIKVNLNAENSTITFQKVEYNSQVIIPEKVIIAASKVNLFSIK
ncbi:hypothetical protein [Pedobacter miscanthi]|uniref:hypothetical protein n=1 Tax=Pedobacter miscanthi TaxID=2259170 RepID=UPI0011BFDCB8|nr:hypothetical protein [Pedobacter miscanthi]